MTDLPLFATFDRRLQARRSIIIAGAREPERDRLRCRRNEVGRFALPSRCVGEQQPSPLQTGCRCTVDRAAGQGHDRSRVPSSPRYPAQHESLATSLPKPCAASFRPSTVVRYGKIVSPSAFVVMPCLMARATVWMLSAPSGAGRAGNGDLLPFVQHRHRLRSATRRQNARFRYDREGFAIRIW